MEQEERYQYYKKLYPDWSDEQIWTAISLDVQTKEAVKKGGDNVNFNDEAIVRAIVKAAERWLEEVMPIIYEKVKSFFSRVLASVGEWVKRGIEWLWELLGDGDFVF